MKTPTYSSVRRRTKRLTTKFTADPVLPLLGWTKAAEQVVTGSWGLLPRWTGYAIVVTALWVTGDYLYRHVETAADAVSDAADDAYTDGGGSQ